MDRLLPCQMQLTYIQYLDIHVSQNKPSTVDSNFCLHCPRCLCFLCVRFVICNKRLRHLRIGNGAGNEHQIQITKLRTEYIHGDQIGRGGGCHVSLLAVRCQFGCRRPTQLVSQVCMLYVHPKARSLDNVTDRLGGKPQNNCFA